MNALHKQVLRVADIARLLDVCPATVRNRLRAGDLPPMRRFGKGQPFYFASDLPAALRNEPIKSSNRAA